MLVVRHDDGSFSLNLSAAEVDELTFEIAITPSQWAEDPYFHGRYAGPEDMPLSKLHKAIHAEHKAAREAS